jgi:hypothetical protein
MKCVIKGHVTIDENLSGVHSLFLVFLCERHKKSSQIVSKIFQQCESNKMGKIPRENTVTLRMDQQTSLLLIPLIHHQQSLKSFGGSGISPRKMEKFTQSEYSSKDLIFFLHNKNNDEILLP